MELQPNQVAWLNQQARRPARRLVAIRRRLEAGECKDTTLTTAIGSAIAALLAVCEVTHERLEAGRPPLANPYKPSSGKRTRLSLEEQARHDRALIERGRADEPRLSPEPDNPLGLAEATEPH